MRYLLIIMVFITSCKNDIKTKDIIFEGTAVFNINF